MSLWIEAENDGVEFPYTNCPVFGRFQHICYCILDDESLSRDKVTEELLPAMLKMASDPIVNVRITLGKTLAHHVITSGWFTRVVDP